MSIVQRHIPTWDCVEAERAEAADQLAGMSITDICKVALMAATALKGVPGIEGSIRDIYDRCCDSFFDVYEAPTKSDLSRAQRDKLREAVWSGEHPAPPSPTFGDYVAKMKPPVFVREVL